MGILKVLNQHKGDIVNIKFKSINDIMAQSDMDYHSAEEHYEIGENIKAYLASGHFLVEREVNVGNIGCKEDLSAETISVTNHIDNNWNFIVRASSVESIEIVNDSERFICSDLKIALIRVEDELFINGKPLVWNEEHDERVHNNDQRKLERGKYENPKRKFLKIIENYIADMALKDSLNPGEEQ